MKTPLKIAEYVTSGLAYPLPAVTIANRLIEGQELYGRELANISPGCKIRGRIDLNENTNVSKGCKLQGDIEIGAWTNLNKDIEMVGEISVGKFCALAREVIFQQKDHQTSKPGMQMRFYNVVLDSKLEHTTKGPIDIGNDVWIGTRTLVLSGVTIGDGAVVGAGSIVTSDVEPYSVVAGVPAEHKSWRFPEEIRDKLLEVKWWDQPIDVLKINKKFFDEKIETPKDIPEF